MLIKEKDKNLQRVDYLTDLLDRELPEDKERLVQRQLKCLDSKDKNEKSSVYYLDFKFKDSKNWALIHDLRIEHNGQVAQIDHLLIGRMMDIYVIESKSFTSGVSISDEGDFSYFYKNKTCPISSPIAQNERDIKLLDHYLTDNNLYPKRLGVALKPNYINIVLVSPESKLIKPKKGLYDCSAVMTSDKFSNYFEDDLDSEPINSLVSITKVISPESLRSFSEMLACHHVPLTNNYSAEFGINDSSDSLDVKEVPDCPQCTKPMVKRIVKKGKNSGNEFWGCSDYPKCKGTVAITVEKIEKEIELVSSNKQIPDCPKCNKPMKERVSTKGDTKGKPFWGCSDFPKCKGSLQIRSESEQEASAPLNDEPPLCPKCNETMVKRAAKKGDTAGKEFWGCSNFPKCRGVVSIE